MNIFPKYLALALALFLAVACSRQPQSTADVPRLISQTHRISVAPFTQPLDPGQLIVGQLPEDQGKIPPDVLTDLDLDLRSALGTATHRQYIWLPSPHPQEDLNVSHATSQPDALGRWLAYGRKHNAQYLLVPMIIDWHEREGSQAGVEKSAHAKAEFFLLNVPAGGIVSRSTFEEKQVGLIDNLLGVGDFIKRKGQWVTARQLTQEGMLKAIKDLGL